jgi:hypothetical protein
VRDDVEKHGAPAEVVFVLFSEGDLETYLRALAGLRG